MASRILSRTGPLALARCWPEPGSPRPLWTFGALRALNCKPGPKAVLAPLDLTDGQLMKLNISRSKLSNRFLSFLFSSPLLAVPIQLQQARMVCLPKPGKVKNYAVPVDGTRPITVLNVWWRLRVSTLCQSKGLKAWLKTALHPSTGAVANQDIFENLISIFDHFHQQGFLLTLDYSKAFDTISTDMSVSLLDKYGWPPNITGLLNAVWGSQNRFIQYSVWSSHS